jgi:hypothetical protein
VFSLRGKRATSRRAAPALAALLACASAAAAQTPAPSQTPAPTPSPAAAAATPAPTPSAASAQTSAAAQTSKTASGQCKATNVPGGKAEPAPGDLAGIRVSAKGADKQPLRNRRLFLFSQSAARAQGLAPDFAPQREKFLARADGELVKWLAARGCETLRCAATEEEYDEARKTVPEFQKAYQRGMDKYHNHRLALRWMPVNFTLGRESDEYHRARETWLENTAVKAGALASAVTDDKGFAYFTGLKPGTYYVANLLPFEPGGAFWDCEVKTPGPVPRAVYSVMLDMTAPAAKSAAAK